MTTSDDDGIGCATEEAVKPGSRFGPENNLMEIGEELGSGAAAKVYSCTVVATGEEFAVKVINLGKLKLLGDFESHIVKLNREVDILRGLTHPRIVNLRLVHKSENWIFLVMELVRGGELFDHIVRSKTFSEVEARHIFKQLLDGIRYMHSKNVIHRDLKPENILVASSQELQPPLTGKLREVKIADFGLSKVISEGNSYAKTFVGTPQYWAPEVLNVQRGGGSYTQAADFWSLGAILYVMLGGRYPFDGKSMPLEEQIRTGTFAFKTAAWQRVSEEAKDMIRGLLKVDPIERLKVEDCEVHPWLTGGQHIVSVTPQVQTKQLEVTEMSSSSPTGTGPVPVVTQPSVGSSISARSASIENVELDTAKSSTSTMGKEDGTGPSTPDARSPHVQCVEVETSTPDKDKEIIFCLQELLKLQVSIAGSLELASLAFRHSDRDVSDLIRRTLNQALKLSAEASQVVSNYSTVAQQVSRDILPDLQLAIQEKEPSLAVALLGMVKDWVADMKKNGESIQRKYNDLQESVQELIISAQRAKHGAEMRLAQGLQAQVAEAELRIPPHSPSQPPVLALEQGNTDLAGRSSDWHPVSMQSAGGSCLPHSRGPVRTEVSRGGPSVQDVSGMVGEANKQALSVPVKMDVWTRHLFEQLSAVQEHGAVGGGGKSPAGKDLAMLTGESSQNMEAWKSEVLDLLFMAPGMGPMMLPAHEASMEAEEILRSVSEARSSSREHADSAGSSEDVTMPDAVQRDAGSNSIHGHVPNDAIMRYMPGGAGASTADEAIRNSSGALLRALRELKRVDEILQGCSTFWANMDGTVQKLSQMKEHTEVLVNYANSSTRLRERFDERLSEYTAFWKKLERLCSQYCADQQSASKRMYEVMHEASEAADVFDTAQSARLSMLAVRGQQHRNVGYMVSR
eukprot:TRINITY_DN27321_c0_g1_i1.p1 TRINITY_DN27321_c0_g1~~TRINITY_DN27321_c0_g1_i1.p1  ORF type:complete len:921 (+),score=190.72 TRINITY_DN27321_c0_g1_i1:30-2765(+)